MLGIGLGICVICMKCYLVTDALTVAALLAIVRDLRRTVSPSLKGLLFWLVC